MREIKFRAKGIRENKDKWFVGSLFVEDGMGITYIVSGVNTHYETNYLQVEVASETVGQFTGLKDSNGKEIYEGDVIKLDNEVYIVSWAKYSACWFVDLKKFGPSLFSQYHAGKSIVIGNVHDNPELIS